MLMHILSSTPKWVFILFIALLWLGINQMLPRRVSLNRATMLPLAMTGLSFYGITSAFGDSHLALLVWLGSAVLAVVVCLQFLNSDGIQFDAARRKFHIPGSAVPLALFMGIFFTKYAVGVSIGMQPALTHSSDFTLAVSALYGAFSGVFMARAVRMWRLAFGKIYTPSRANLIV